MLLRNVNERWLFCTPSPSLYNSEGLNVTIYSCSSSHKGEGGSGNYVASGYSVYEEENERLQEGLRAKVNALKSVSTVDSVQRYSINVCAVKTHTVSVLSVRIGNIFLNNVI